MATFPVRRFLSYGTVSRLDPRGSSRDHLASFREASVTIRFEGPLAPTFVEVDGAELASIEPLET